MIISIQILCAAAGAALPLCRAHPSLALAPTGVCVLHGEWLRVGAPVVDAGELGVARAADESAAAAARAFGAAAVRCIHSKALGEWGRNETSRGALGGWACACARARVCGFVWAVAVLNGVAVAVLR